MKSTRSNDAKSSPSLVGYISNQYRKLAGCLVALGIINKVTRMVVQKLTKAVIGALKPESKEYFVWDSELTGFGVRISPKGRKTYILRIWAPTGAKKQILQSIGAAHLLYLILLIDAL